MTAMELGRLDWSRVDLRIGDVAYGRAHLWGDGTTYHVADVNGGPIGDLTVRADEDGCRTVLRLDAKTYEMTGEDGTVWHLSRAGCNCGG